MTGIGTWLPRIPQARDSRSSRLPRRTTLQKQPVATEDNPPNDGNRNLVAADPAGAGLQKQPVATEDNPPIIKKRFKNVPCRADENYRDK